MQVSAGKVVKIPLQGGLTLKQLGEEVIYDAEKLRIEVEVGPQTQQIAIYTEDAPLPRHAITAQKGFVSDVENNKLSFPLAPGKNLSTESQNQAPTGSCEIIFDNGNDRALVATEISKAGNVYFELYRPSIEEAKRTGLDPNRQEKYLRFVTDFSNPSGIVMQPTGQLKQTSTAKGFSVSSVGRNFFIVVKGINNEWDLHASVPADGVNLSKLKKRISFKGELGKFELNFRNESDWLRALAALDEAQKQMNP